MTALTKGEFTDLLKFAKWDTLFINWSWNIVQSDIFYWIVLWEGLREEVVSRDAHESNNKSDSLNYHISGSYKGIQL